MDARGSCAFIQEDEAIIKLVEEHGIDDWSKIAAHLK